MPMAVIYTKQLFNSIRPDKGGMFYVQYIEEVEGISVELVQINIVAVPV